MLKRHFLTVACFLIFSQAYTYSLLSKRGFEYFFSTSRDYLDNNVHLAAVYLDSALAVASANEHRDQLGVCYNQRGLISLRTGELDSAEHYYLRALDYFKGSADSLKVRPLKNLGVLAYFKGDMETAIGRHLDALEYYLEAEDATEIARTYSNLGVFYKNSGQFIAASKSYIQSLEYFEINKDQVGLANTYNNIGSIYVELERYNEALEYFQRALGQSENGSAEDMAIWHHNMALSLRELGMLDSARHYQRISLDMRRQLGDSSGIAQSYHELGSISYAKEDYATAKHHFIRAHRIAQRMGDVKYQALTLNNLAETELATGHPQKALDLLRKHDHIGAQAQIQSQMTRRKHEARANYLLSNHSLALDLLKQYQMLHDSIKNVTINMQLDELNTIYESNEKEKIINEQRLALQVSQAEYRAELRVIILAGGAILIVIAIALVYLKYQNVKKSKLLLEGQVRIAKSQMSPEFLNKSLDIVKRLLDKSPEASEEAVYKLSSLYQKMVENFDEDLIPLEEELNLLEKYLELVSIGSAATIYIKNDILSPEKYAVVPFSLQVLFDSTLENTAEDLPQHIRLYESGTYIVVENQSSGRQYKTRSSFTLIDQKYQVVCGNGITIEQPDYGTLIKLPKIEWAL
ncbi:MAG: tetratricopeptide repeat protein [Cyclobacteriaceae bacterium]